MVEPREGVIRVRVDRESGRGHVSGVKRCASPWACPTCSFKIRQARADELTELVERARAEGGSALLVTATVPHGPEEPLSDVLAALQDSWRDLWSGRWAKDTKARYGIVGSVRAIEVTWGAGSGWHPHCHAVLVLDQGVLDAELVELWGRLMLRWQRIVEARTGRAVNLAHAFDVRLVDDPRNVAEYVTDTGSWSVGAEVASGPVKLGRSSGRWSPFALLAAAVEWGDMDAGRLFTEYESATMGKRAIVASRGLFELYGIRQAAEEDAAEGPEVDDVLAEVQLDPLLWAALGAVDAQRAYVAAVEAWAADGARGQPPDPIEQLTLALGGADRG